jgi:flagellar assembly protein FliH
MGLIKSSNAPPTMSPFSMKDIENQARAILLRAQQKAEQLLAAAQAEALQIKAVAKIDALADAKRDGLAQGMEQGRQAGQREALAQAQAELKYGASALASAVAELEASRAELESAATQEVVRLAIAIARRVTKRQGAIDQDVLTANLHDAMKLVSDASKVRIAIHPAQRQTLDAALPKLKLAFPTLNHCEIIDDASLAPGGCKVFTLNGQIDADLDVQLDRIVADLLPQTSGEGT